MILKGDAIVKRMRDLQIGDVLLMEFDGIGSEQRGIRPGVVFQNNIGNQSSPNIIALPLSSKVKKRTLPTHETAVAIPLHIQIGTPAGTGVYRKDDKNPGSAQA